MKARFQFSISILIVAGFLAAGTAGAPAVEFKKDILPILEESCYKCHGNGKKKSGVNLDAENIANAIGDTIVPHDLEKSELYTALLPGADEVMPPPGKAPKVTDKQIALIKEWIMAGAPLEGKGSPVIAGSGSGMLSGPAAIEGDWINREGVKITATLLRVEGETAILRMAGGKIYNYPIAKLSDESQAKVREFAKASSKS